MVAIGPAAPWVPAAGADPALAVEVHAPRTAAPPPPPRSLRVVTYNVEYSSRADRLIAALSSHRDLAAADVLLLQEIGPQRDDADRARRLAEALAMGHAYAHGVAILSRWPLADVAVMELPRAHLPYNRRRRIALAASIATAGGPLRLTSVHLDTRLELAERIRQLAPAVASEPPLQIIGGDMNTLPFRFARGAIPIGKVDQPAGLDAHLRGLGFDAPVRAAGATHRHVLRVRLDALFTRGFAPAAAQVARDVRVSDHFPVWADLTPAADGG
jgi:endonuclease/exonuclease/phosphatase family metal-dependent hydrolase